MSFRVPLLSLAMLSGVAFPVQAQQAASAAHDVVIINDPGPPPQSTIQSYSGTCANGRIYALELARARDGKVRLSARRRGKIEPVEAPTILDQITGNDLYAVHMHCGQSSAEFEISVSKSGGQLLTQPIGVSDRTGVTVYPSNQP